MSFLCLVFIITSDRWYRCLWFKKKCSEHSGCGTHTTQHFVFGSMSSGLHGHQVAKKIKSNFTSFIQLSEKMYLLTNGEMSQYGGPQGPFMQWLWLHFSVILFVSFWMLASYYDWTSLLCMTACERKRRKNSSESSPRKMNDWPSIPPPSQGLSLRISLALNESCTNFWTNHL